MYRPFACDWNSLTEAAILFSSTLPSTASCAFAQALDLVGERWALLIMRELMFGPRRFTGLKETLPGIATNMLMQRLVGLEDAGVLRRVGQPRPARGKAYALTAWGLASREPLRVIGPWASRSPRRRFDRPLSAAAAMLSLESMFDASRAKDMCLAVDLRLPDGEFKLRVGDGRFDVMPGRAGDPGRVVTGDQNALLSVFFAGKPVTAALADGSLVVEGVTEALGQLAGAFRDLAPLAN